MVSNKNDSEQQKIRKRRDEMKALKRLAVALYYTKVKNIHPDPDLYIVAGIDELPLELPDGNVLKNASWNILNDEDMDYLTEFYDEKVPVQCRIRDCNSVPTGFREVLMHQYVHGRKYTHMCVAKGCHVPFDKLGNAKRHVAT